MCVNYIKKKLDTYKEHIRSNIKNDTYVFHSNVLDHKDHVLLCHIQRDNLQKP